MWSRLPKANASKQDGFGPSAERDCDSVVPRNDREKSFRYLFSAARSRGAPVHTSDRLLSMERKSSKFVSRLFRRLVPVSFAVLLASLFFWNFAHSAAQEAEKPADRTISTIGSADELPSREIPSREMAAQILHRCLMESVWGKPVLCEVRQNIRMFDKKRSSFGKYVRGGQGGGKMRLSLQVPAGDQMNSLLQVGDGELLSTLMDVGEQSTRTQVDLGKIRDRLTITAQSLQDPTIAIYLAVGGQAELLRKLCQQYQWISATEGRLGERKVWWVKGEAIKQPPPVHGLAPIDVRLFDAKTGLSPLRATLAVGHLDSETAFWLYQVEETYQHTNANQSQLTVLTEWDTPSPLTPAQLVPDLFRLSVSDSQALYESRDETKLYLPPVQNNVAGTPRIEPHR